MLLNILGAIILFIYSFFAPAPSQPAKPTLDPKYGIELHLPENYSFVSATPNKPSKTGEIVKIEIAPSTGSHMYLDVVTDDYASDYTDYSDFATCKKDYKFPPVSSVCIVKNYHYIPVARTAMFSNDECSPGSYMWSVATNPKSKYRYLVLYQPFIIFSDNLLEKYPEYCVDGPYATAANNEFKTALPNLIEGKGLAQPEKENYDHITDILNSIEFIAN